jgi:hypothetical protein
MMMLAPKDSVSRSRGKLSGAFCVSPADGSASETCVSSPFLLTIPLFLLTEEPWRGSHA